MIKQVAVEVALHVVTVAVILLLAAGVSHRAGSSACGKHLSYSAHAASK